MNESVIVKAAAELTPGQDDESAPHGSFDVILSTPDLDRDGEEVRSSEWKRPLPEHITFDTDHAMSVEKTVGSGKPFINDEGNLQVRGTYASTQLAQLTRTLVNEGHIRTTSVTFLRHTSDDAKGAKVTTRELLNGAFVPVPANPHALVLASKTGARNSAKDAERIQSIHDLSVSNGAECKHPPEKNATDPEIKAAAPAPAPSPADVAALIARARALAE